jgi:hypothetical protein
MRTVYCLSLYLSVSAYFSLLVPHNISRIGDRRNLAISEFICPTFYTHFHFLCSQYSIKEK